MREVIHELGQVRGRSKLLLVLQRGSVVLASGLALLVVMIGADYLIRLPSVFRCALLIVGIVGVVCFTVRYLVPVIVFKPTLTELALRVEKSLPNLSGRLASSVEFAMEGTNQSNPLAARSVKDTESRLQDGSLGKVISFKNARRDMGALFLVVTAIVVASIASPSIASTGISRMLLPFGSAQWPARTSVVSLMDNITVHPRGQTLALRAKGTKAPGDKLNEMYVGARYRLKVEGRYEDWHDITLSPQGSARYERLVDTDAQEIEFYFESDDFRTGNQRVTLVPPPSIERATLSVEPPAYAVDYVKPTDFDLGPGIDERSVTPAPSLIGSRAILRFEFNKPLPVPSDSKAQSRWLASAIGWEDLPEPDVIVDEESTQRLQLSWQLAGTRSLSVLLRDEYGLSNIEDIAYRIDTFEDRSPSVTITDPESDQAVLGTAIIPLTVEARDDVAVKGIGLNAKLRPAVDKQSSQHLWDKWQETSEYEMLYDFDLSTLELKEGDVVEIIGLAEDIYELNGNRHDIAKSAIRRLRIISGREFGESVFQELKALRQHAIRLEAQQAELQDDIIDDGVQPGVDRAQERISQRLADQLDALNRLNDRIEMNRFEDNQIDSLISQAEDLLAHAGQASNKANEAIENRQAEKENEPQEEVEEDDNKDEDELQIREPDEKDEEIVESQQEVRDELRDLIESLDRNEDTWVMNQRIRDLLEQQEQLQSETQSLNNQTRGRELDELEQVELSELDRIAQRQKELAEQMRNLIDDLRDRAGQMEEIDPSAAEAQNRAADTAEKRETDQKMENAAESTSNNQLQNAQNSQQQARNDLEQMLEDLDHKRAKAEELQRRLASLIESIERLVTMQEDELSALERAKENNDFTGRDRAMIRLNQNTQMVSGEARAAGPESGRIARALDRAADSQGAAVAYFREIPMDLENAQLAEQHSLDMLREALELAEELQEQVEKNLVEQKRQELMQRYSAMMEREVGLRGETSKLAELEKLDRRALVEARRQGNIQEEIRAELEAIRAQTEEVSNSEIFSAVHEMMNTWSLTVSEFLRDGNVSASVTDRQFAIADSLANLIEALDSENNPEEFEDSNSNGGGGQGQGQNQPPPLVPPLAELKLLRGMQEHVYNQTRDLDTRSDLENADRRQRIRELGRQQEELLRLGELWMEKNTQNNNEANPDERGGHQ